MRSRLDQLLVSRGLIRSRARARDAVLRGCVRVSGALAEKPGQLVDEGADLALADPAAAYVARSALKLIAALDAFGFDPAGRIALDVGASTGGFTEVLLERGAARIYAVDVGHGQLDPALAADPRVVNIEGLNARDLDRTAIPEPVGAIVVDVSFISLALVLEPVLALATPDAFLVALVKPQFEVGRDALGKGGIVRDGDIARAAVDRIGAHLATLGWQPAGPIDSPLPGGDGNREFLIGARH